MYLDKLIFYDDDDDDDDGDGDYNDDDDDGDYNDDDDDDDGDDDGDYNDDDDDEFKQGRESLKDDPHPGRPPTAVVPETIAAVEKLLKEDGRLTYEVMQEKVGIGSTALNKILHDHLEVRKVAARWVPHCLTEAQKEHRVNWCQFMLEKFDSGRSKRVYDIVTGDESWIYQFDPETKRQSSVWIFPGEHPPQKFKRSRSVGKKMVASFFGKTGHVATIPLDDRRTVNTDCDPRNDDDDDDGGDGDYNDDDDDGDYNDDDDDDDGDDDGDYNDDDDDGDYNDDDGDDDDDDDDGDDDGDYNDDDDDDDGDGDYNDDDDDDDEFKQGRESLKDDPHPGRPPTAVVPETIAAVEKLLKEDGRLTYEVMQEKVGIGSTALNKILHDHLEVRKVAARWVPHCLTEAQKEHRVNWCQFMLEKFDSGRSKRVYDIVTGDESWIYQFDPETKRQSSVWIFPGEHPPQKFKRSRSVGKKMVASFFGKTGHVATIPLDDRRTVNTDCDPRNDDDDDDGGDGDYNDDDDDGDYNDDDDDDDGDDDGDYNDDDDDGDYNDDDGDDDDDDDDGDDDGDYNDDDDDDDGDGDYNDDDDDDDGDYNDDDDDALLPVIILLLRCRQKATNSSKSAKTNRYTNFILVKLYPGYQAGADT
eukprot:gene10560-biopygen13084